MGTRSRFTLVPWSAYVMVRRVAVMSKEAHRFPTPEGVFEETLPTIRRRYDRESGLALIDLEANDS